MTTMNTLPSIFNAEADNLRTAQTDAPTFITHITAHVLGRLIAERLIRYDDDPMSILQTTEYTIAAAVNEALNSVDLVEAATAQDARQKAMWQARETEKQARRVNAAAPHNKALEREVMVSVLRMARNEERAAQGLPPLAEHESPYSDNLKRALAALDALDTDAE